MGWCQEFGVQIRDGCDHLMVGGVDACTCAECGVGCLGKFAGCPGLGGRAGAGNPPAPGRRPPPSGVGRPRRPNRHGPTARARRHESSRPSRPEGRQPSGGRAAPADGPSRVGCPPAARGGPDDLAGLPKQVTADIGQLSDKLRQPSDLAAQAAIIGGFDTRFEWLVNELSDRFVVLGNEVARIK